jgi:hypothetical protein
VNDDENGSILFQKTKDVSEANVKSIPQDVNEGTTLKVY